VTQTQLEARRPAVLRSKETGSLFLFGSTVFLSGALLFLVEPMFAKMALPKLGGSPAVWNVCVVFYQAVLLMGYALSHQIAKRFTPRRAALLQAGMVLAAFLALPIRLPAMLGSPLKHNPTLWLLSLLAIGIGLPFLVLSSFSSTIQTWYASTSRKAVNNPYVLYAAGNLGSMLALFAYPLLMERYLGLSEQSKLWEWGYTVLIALTCGCAFVLWFVPESQAGKNSHRSEQTEVRPTPLQELKWLAFAFIPSSLMLGVTTALTTELPPIPLFWVLPLAVYLVSFILVFATKPAGYHKLVIETVPILLLVIAFPLISKSVLSPLSSIPFYLMTLFFACVACHGELAISLPSAAHLTRFYLFVSLGGVLGGFFNAILAPLLFSSVVELPLVLFLLALVVSRWSSAIPRHSIDRRDVILPIVLGLGVAIVALWLRSTTFRASPVMNFVVFAGPLMVCFSFSRRPIRFALGFGALLLASGLYSGQYGKLLMTQRSFFGVYRVSEDSGYRQLIHGSTIHGLQSMDSTRAREPLAYYYETGPIGQVFRSSSIGRQLHEVGVVGLGAGSLACYSESGRHFTFYEIDPTVERVARDGHYFTYLQDCSPGSTVVIGDARLSLQSVPAQKYDLVVVDAFSSDTIPVHLATREAIQLYFDKLSGHGLLALNISNRYLDIRPALAALARDAGLACVVQEDVNIDGYEQSRGKFASTWVLMARQRSDFAELASQPRWHDIPLRSARSLWTDEYSSVVGIIRWD
jgi:spermidine synthase